MKIHPKIKLRQLQEAFKQQFPYLQIRFYKVPHTPGSSSSEELTLDPQTVLGKIIKIENPTEMMIDPKLTTAAFEQMISQRFNLHVQVFRKSYGKWLQTWATDEWSLEDQNQRSMIMGDWRGAEC